MVQIIEGSAHSPEIIIDSENSFIALRGICVPKSGEKLFNPILSLADEIIDHTGCIHLTLELKHLNSVANHYLLKLFKKIAERLQNKSSRIEWRFDPEDEEIREKGELLAELTGLSFEFVMRKSSGRR